MRWWPWRRDPWRRRRRGTISTEQLEAALEMMRRFKEHPPARLCPAVLDVYDPERREWIRYVNGEGPTVVEVDKEEDV